MKYFIKEALYGISKTDIERVMTHYTVSENEAIKMLKEKELKELLPPRLSRNRR